LGTASAPSYGVVFNSNNEGVERGQISSPTVGSELAAGSGAFQTNTLSQATNAEFTLSGVTGTITRASNSVSDVLTGVTLNFQSLGAATVTISSDKSQTISAVKDFVDAYNELQSYIKANDAVTEEEGDEGSKKHIFGPLANTSLDENLLSSLRDAFSGAALSGQTVNVLADLGITTQRDGSLAFDEDTFEEALGTDPTSVSTLFENLGEDLASVDGRIAQFTRFGGLIDQASNSNTSQINSFQSRIADLEKVLDRQKETLTQQFARLEGLIGKLNSQQSSLGQLLGG
jgi:flagellar hook-associated protein 2